MSKKILASTAFILFAMTPVFVDAAFSGVRDLLDSIGQLIQSATYIVSALALLAFFWGLAQFVFKAGAGDKTAYDNGKNLMKWGLVALFVMVSVWGIVAFMQRQLGLPTTVGPSAAVPNLPVQTGISGSLPGTTVNGF